MRLFATRQRKVSAVLAAMALVVGGITSTAAGSDAAGPPSSDITGFVASYSPEGVLDVVVNYAGKVGNPPVEGIPVVGWILFGWSEATGNFFVSGDTNCTPETPKGGCLHFVQGLAPSVPTVCITAIAFVRDPQNQEGRIVDTAPDFRSEVCPGDRLQPEAGGNALAISLGETAVIAD